MIRSIKLSGHNISRICVPVIVFGSLREMFEVTDKQNSKRFFLVPVAVQTIP